MKRSHGFEFSIAMCIVCLIVVTSNMFFTKDGELDCRRSTDTSLPSCSLVQTSMVSRKVIHIKLLKAAYINVTKNKSRKGEITSNYSVTLLTDSGEIELSESHTELAQQEVDRINYFINSSQPSLYIREEHLKDAWNIFKIFGIIGLVFVFFGWLTYIGVIG